MIWTTREGERIEVSKMTNDHLRNTIIYLERRITSLCEAESAAWRTYSMLQGEMACDVAEEGIDALELAIDNLRFVRDFMSDELRRRQL
jgi:hypothetical protein